MGQSAFTALRHRDFRLFWAGQGISLTGTHMQRVAVAWHVYQLTHSPVALGLLGAFRFVPVLLLALPGGTLADRFDRRLLLLGATTVMALSSLLLWGATAWGVESVELVYAVVALQAAAAAMGGPARQAMVPNLVPPEALQPAVTLSMLTWDVAGVAGPAVGGLWLAAFGPASIYLFDAVTYGAVMLALVSMTHVKVARAPEADAPPLQAMREGIAWVMKQPLIRTTMLLDFFATLFGQATVLFPIFADEVLHTGPQGLGFLYSAPALGSVVTGFTLALFPPVKEHGRWLLGSVVLYGVATVVFGLSVWFPLTVVALMVSGGADTVSTILRQTLRQRLTPDTLRGRMTGVNMLFFNGGPQLGELESGLLTAAVGVQLCVTLGGVGVLLTVALAVWWVPSLRTYRDA